MNKYLIYLNPKIVGIILLVNISICIFRKYTKIKSI